MLMNLLSIYTSLICLSPEQSSGEETDDVSSEDESSSVESEIYQLIRVHVGKEW